MARPADPSPSFLAELCGKEGFALAPEQAQRLAAYLGLLMQWNRAMNLVGATHWRDALNNLVLDSFHLERFLRGHVLPALPASPEAWDLGAGAGLPGIPLRILWDGGRYTLVESRDKRTIFLSTFLARNPLPGTAVFHGRAEAFMKGRKADLILSRAFMPWREMLDFVAEGLAPGGRVVFLANEDYGDAPAGWTRGASASYAVGKERRWFCSYGKAE